MLRGEFDPPTKLFEVNLNFNPRALEDHLHAVSREMGRFNRQIASLMEEMTHLKGATSSMSVETNESIERMNKMLIGHESQLKVVQQTSAMTVTSTQFNSTLTLVREQIKGLELQVAKFEGPNSKKSLEVLEGAIDDFIAKWYRGTLQKDLETREVRSQEFTRNTVDREVTALSAALDAQLAVINRQLASAATLDQLRNFTEITRDRVKHESELVDERLNHFTATLERSNRDIAESIAQMDQRVAYVSSRVAPLVAYDDGARSPPSNLMAMSLDAPKNQATLVASVDVNLALAGTPDANQTLFILKSPAFTVFRQQVLEDIRARLGIAKNETAAESDDQMHDVRLEVKQRTTPERVVELIKQHQDVSTPAAVAELSKVVQRLDRDKVGHPEFVEGLRAKGDLHVLTQKADTFAVQEVVGVLQTRIERLESTMTVHQSERDEFRDVLKDVVYMHKRAQVLDSAGGATTSPRSGSRIGGKSTDAVPQLPAISASQVPRPPPQAAQGGGDVDPRSQSSMTARGKGAIAGGNATPTRQHAKGNTPVNRTDMKPSVVDFPAQQQSAQSANSRSPVLSTQAPGGNAAPLSSSQRAYAERVGANVSADQSAVGGWSSGLKDPGDRGDPPLQGGAHR